jgi:hypothetical protein
VVSSSRATAEKLCVSAARWNSRMRWIKSIRPS